MFCEVHVQDDPKNGYSVFFESDVELGVEEEIVNKAISLGKIDASDKPYVDYAMEINADEFADAVHPNKTVQVLIINRKGSGANSTTVKFAGFDSLKKYVDEAIENSGYRKVEVELSPSWDTTDEEDGEFFKIENED